MLAGSLGLDQLREGRRLDVNSHLVMFRLWRGEIVKPGRVDPAGMTVRRRLVAGNGTCSSAPLGYRTGAILLLRDLPKVFPRMQHLWADAGYIGKLAGDIKTALGWTLEIVKPPWPGWQRTWTPKDAPPRIVEGPKGFVVLKRRWVARTFAWLGKSRRMAKDDEALVETAENLV